MAADSHMRAVVDSHYTADSHFGGSLDTTIGGAPRTGRIVVDCSSAAAGLGH